MGVIHDIHSGIKSTEGEKKRQSNRDKSKGKNTVASDLGSYI